MINRETGHLQMDVNTHTDDMVIIIINVPSSYYITKYINSNKFKINFI